jgi:ketosteroid isomerase-like protein
VAVSAQQEDLQRLLDEREIEQVLVAYVRAIDRRDRGAIKAVYHPDATDDHGDFVGLGVDFADHAIDVDLTHFAATSHLLSNITIDLRGNVAAVESYVLATHVTRREDSERLHIMAGRYLDRFQKREGEWRIAARRVVRDWGLSPITATSWPASFSRALHVPDASVWDSVPH